MQKEIGFAQTGRHILTHVPDDGAVQIDDDSRESREKIMNYESRERMPKPVGYNFRRSRIYIYIYL